MKTREYLDTATKIVTGQRQRDYGNKYENHKNISDLSEKILKVSRDEKLLPY